VAIRSFRRAWLTACLKAGFARLVSEQPRVIESTRIPHDFRRTAIRNLERAGIPRSAAMAMVGHKTESVYRRYAIAEEGMLREAGAKLQTLYDTGAVNGSNGKNAPASLAQARAARQATA
jgi:integrase